MVHLEDGLLQVHDELVAVVLRPGVEREQDAAAGLAADLNAVVEDRGVEQRHLQALEVEAVAVGVSGALGPLAGARRLLGDHHQVVEEEHVALVVARRRLFGRVDVQHLVQLAQTDQAPVGLGQVQRRPLVTGLHQVLLNLLGLEDVVVAAGESALLDGLVDGSEELGVEVGAAVDAAEVVHEVRDGHLLLVLEVGRVEVGVEEHDGEGQRDDRLRRPQLGREPRVALGVTLAEHLHDALDLLRLARHPHPRQQHPEGLVQPRGRKVEVLDEARQDLHGEGTLELAQVLAHLLLGQSAVPLVQEAGHRRRRQRQELLLDQVLDPQLRFGVEEVEADAVAPFPLHFSQQLRELGRFPAARGRPRVDGRRQAVDAGRRRLLDVAPAEIRQPLLTLFVLALHEAEVGRDGRLHPLSGLSLDGAVQHADVVRLGGLGVATHFGVDVGRSGDVGGGRGPRRVAQLADASQVGFFAAARARGRRRTPPGPRKEGVVGGGGRCGARVGALFHGVGAGAFAGGPGGHETGPVDDGVGVDAGVLTAAGARLGAQEGQLGGGAARRQGRGFAPFCRRQFGRRRCPGQRRQLVAQGLFQEGVGLDRRRRRRDVGDDAADLRLLVVVPLHVGPGQQPRQRRRPGGRRGRVGQGLREVLHVRVHPLQFLDAGRQS